MISATALIEFKEIIQKDYGLNLSDIEADKLAENYLIALESVLTPKQFKRGLTKAKERRKNGS